MTTGTNYWTERLAACDHTGWYDPAIYAYDQLERVDVVRRAVERLQTKSPLCSALDFGCGTGDFSRVMLDLGLNVYGFDPYVTPPFQARNFQHLTTLEKISSIPPVDLTLSVTVLDHLLDESDLDAALRIIRRQTNGHLLLLEYALDSESDRTAEMRANLHQSFHTVDHWRAILARHSFRITEIQNMPHPLAKPSPGYQQYRRRLYTKIVRRLLKLRFPVRALLPPLRAQAERSFVPVNLPDPQFSGSPLKLMFCE